MRCIIYGLRHDAIVIDCNALRFGTRWSEVFAITTMESSKVNGKIFISAYVAIRSCNLLHRSPFIPFPLPIIAAFPRVFVTPFLPTRRGWKSRRKRGSACLVPIQFQTSLSSSLVRLITL